MTRESVENVSRTLDSRALHLETREVSNFPSLVIQTRSCVAAYRATRIARAITLRAGLAHSTRLEVHLPHERQCVDCANHDECTLSTAAEVRADARFFAVCAIVREAVARDQAEFEADCALARALRGLSVAYTVSDGALGWVYPRTREALDAEQH